MLSRPLPQSHPFPQSCSFPLLFRSIFRFRSCDLRVLCEMPEKSLCCLLCHPSSFLLFLDISTLRSLITKY